MAVRFSLNGAWIAEQRARICSEIGYAKYEVNEEWFERPVESAGVVTDGGIEAIVLLASDSDAPITVTGVELYDRNGLLIGRRNVSIEIPDGTQGMLYRCRIELFEIEENETGTGAYDAAEE